MPPSRASANELGRLLEAVEQPIYVVNDERRIVFCNQACRDWTALAAEELIGQECRYHSHPETTGAAATAAALCPPPEAFQGRRVQASIILPRSSDADQQETKRRVEFFPLGVGGTTPVMAIVAPDDTPVAEAESGDLAPTSSAALHQRLQLYRRRLALRFHVDRLIGDSPAMRQVRAQVRMAVGARGNVVIVGPEGSGRQNVARAIHYAAGAEKSGALAPLASALLDADLLEATLRGLTKARQADAAQAPTLLLGDADQLPSPVQLKLVEALRAASMAPRVLATAREPLAALAARGAFRHDLACLLSTLEIRLPPLNERIEDVPLAAQWLLEQTNSRGDKQVSGFAAESLDRLAGYHWPGDMAELESLVAEVHARCEGSEIAPSDLPPRVAWAAEAFARPRRGGETIVLEEFLATIERELIERALTRSRGNKTQAARLLGMTRPRFYRRLVQLGFEIGGEEGEDES